ncbi:MAG: SusC/RagA family TonB-linked outer membrane protein [Bacteroidales bacterium]|nr:SusC/RagA family TonB-linked outer membrane protein [Bacteroidales bacterium]
MRKLYTLLMIFLLVEISAFAQKMNIEGTIKTSKGEALPGSIVLIKGSPGGVSAGMDGKFYIKAQNGEILVVSFIGYETQEITISNQSILNIIMKETAQQLNEVVVTALGIEKQKTNLGYSISDINGNEVVKARDQNPITGLTGRVAGLSVGQSPEMLRKPNVLLRGNELNLYVVDGVPISSDTWNISPDDIQSYTILKGPTASALYGSRGQNGAILITTKKGSGKKGFSVEFNTSNSWDNGFLAFPRNQKEYGGGENCLYAFGDGKGGGLNDNDYDVWGPKFRGQLLPQYDGIYHPDETFTTTFPGGLEYTGHIEPTPYLARGKNNLKNFLQTGFQTTNNISVSSTGDNYNLRLSLSNSYQQSIIPNMDLNIYNFNIYGSYNISRKLKVEGNINLNRQGSENFPDVDYGPNSIIYNVATWTGADWDVNDPKIRGIWQEGKVGTQSVFAEYQRYHNPWFMSYEWLRGHHKTDTYAYVSANYKIDDHININLRSQISTYNLLRTERMPFSAHPYGREENSGDYREDHRNLFDNNTDIQIIFNYSVKNFLNISGLAGGNIRLFNYNSNFTTTDYLNIPNVYSFSNSKNPVQSNNFESTMGVYSGYGSVDLGFGKFATLALTARADKSSALLPSKNTTFVYPSVSISTAINQYVKLPEVISYFKLRGSFASVRGASTSESIGTAPFNTITAVGGGSSNSIYGYPLGYGNNYLSPYGGPNFNLVTPYNISKDYNNQAAAGFSGNLVDPNIKASNRVNFEGGFDLRLFKNRVGFDFTVFQYLDGPSILANSISSTTGYETYYINALKTRKTGFEASLSVSPVRNASGLQWDVVLNYDTYKEVYQELPAGQEIYQRFFKVGDRVDKLYSSDFWRDSNGQIINDNNGKPIANPVPQYLGDLNGKFRWALINKLNYKQFSLAFQFDGNVGGVMVDYLHNKTMRGGSNIETVKGAFGVARDLDDQNAGDPNWKGSYVGEGVVVSNNVPIEYDSETGAITNYSSLQFESNTTTTQVQDYISKYYNISRANLMSKTYTKLREVTISYDLPANLLEKTGIGKCTISLVGRNLIYFYANKNFTDVDLDQYNYGTGSTGLQSPTTRRFGFNINVVF